LDAAWWRASSVRRIHFEPTPLRPDTGEFDEVVEVNESRCAQAPRELVKDFLPKVGAKGWEPFAIQWRGGFQNPYKVSPGNASFRERRAPNKYRKLAGYLNITHSLSRG